jgi:hypothetical protein
LDDVVGHLDRASRRFDRLLLLGWHCHAPTEAFRKVLGLAGVATWAADLATYESLKGHGTVDVGLDPIVYARFFGARLRDDTWRARFDGTESSSAPHQAGVPAPAIAPPPAAMVAGTLHSIDRAPAISADRWSIVLSSVLLGVPVTYATGTDEDIGRRLMLHFGGTTGPLATPADTTPVHSLDGPH